MGKKLLVIGGTGFIGSQLLRKAVNDGFDCTSIATTPPMVKARVDHVAYIEIDLGDKDRLYRYLSAQNFSVIINAGGYVGHDESLSYRCGVFRNHVESLLNLLECLDFDQIEHFLHIGSGDEYGRIKSPMHEFDREMPCSPYASAKLTCSQLLLSHARLRRLPITVMRVFLTYGPGQRKNRLIPFCVENCLNGEAFKISSGDQIRDFLYIDDLVEAVFKIITNTESFGEIINIGSGEPSTIRKTVEKIHQLIGRGKPLFGQEKRHIGEVNCIVPDITKLRSMINWVPRVTLDEGIQKMVDFYR